VVILKATSVFEADDSRLGAVLARINGRMLALQPGAQVVAGLGGIAAVVERAQFGQAVVVSLARESSGAR
jgi:hypothetical protein